MKKIMIAAIFLSISGIANSSQIDGTNSPVDQSQPRLSMLQKLTNACKDPRNVGLSVALGSHLAKNGLNCPLAREAQNPIAAGVAAALAVRMLQSEKKCVRYAAAIPAAAAPLLLLKK